MVCSPGSQRSVSRGTVHSRSRSRSQSRSGSIERSYTHSNHSRSASRSFSRHSSHSHRSGRSRSRSHYSRSRSHSDHRHSRSWTRSRSRTCDRSAYSSRSRSGSRSRSRSSYRGGRRKSFFRSRTRSCSYHSDAPSRSRSHTPASRTVSPSSKGGRDPRDRSKRAHWTNNVWLVGEKAKDTVFHFCDICDLPIVIYGRLLPCKHVLCYTCAMNIMNKCKRCQKSVQTVERCLVGGIFMCFESDTCRRTYLSQRDLQAHIDHRHRTGSTSGNSGGVTTVTTTANNNSNDNNNNSNNSNNNASMSRNDIVNLSETIISVASQHMNFTDGTSLLSGGVKATATTTPTPTNSNTVTTTIPMLDKITVSNAQMSLLGPSPRMVMMNTMIPPNCTTTPPNIFINNQKSSGLLPLPTQTTMPAAVSSSILHSTRPPIPSAAGLMTRPAGINNPSVIGSNSNISSR
ncbi:unnamed protein product [Trichobilharzia szidati]|nr:unnamed protein product [Trichobilharzia szidati]